MHPIATHAYVASQLMDRLAAADRGRSPARIARARRAARRAERAAHRSHRAAAQAGSDSAA